jgi:CheY-like chemotaxis protein
MDGVKDYPILVVEESDADFDTLVAAARGMGLRNELLRAGDMEEARRHIAATAQAGRSFSFVMLDQMLPGSMGEALSQELRADSRLCRLPVVVVSASAPDDELARCYAAGANACHVKPAAHDSHLAMLELVFGFWLRHAVLPDCRPPERAGRPD